MGVVRRINVTVGSLVFPERHFFLSFLDFGAKPEEVIHFFDHIFFRLTMILNRILYNRYDFLRPS